MSEFVKKTFSRNNTKSILIWTAIFVPIWTTAWSVQKGRFDFGPILFASGLWIIYVVIAWVAYKRKWK